MDLCYRFKKNKFDIAKFIKEQCKCKDKKFFKNLLNSFNSEICSNEHFQETYKNFKKIMREDLEKLMLDTVEKKLNADELKKYINEIVPLRRDFYIGQNLELNLVKFIQYCQNKIDDIYSLDCYRQEEILLTEILKQVEQIKDEIYKFNKNTEIDLNFFFKNYKGKPLMSDKLEREIEETGENEQFGIQSTDILK